MISLNNIDNLFQSVIMVDANGNRVVNSTMAGQNRQPQKNSYALPQNRFSAPGVPKILTCLALHIIVFPGGTSTGPAPAGWSSRGGVTQGVVFGWPTEFEDSTQQHQFVPRVCWSGDTCRAAISLPSSKLHVSWGNFSKMGHKEVEES